MLLKCCTQYARKFGKLNNGHKTGKGQFLFQPQKGNAKECSNYHRVALISHASKVMLKILPARLQQYMNRELQMQKWIQKRQGNQRSNCQHPVDHTESKGISGKTFTSASLTMLKPLTVWITTNCGKLFKRWEYQNTLPAS